MKWTAPLKGFRYRNSIAGRFTFLRRLGIGGQGEVWLARDTRLSRLVTLKKIDARLSSLRDERLHSLQSRVDIAHPAIPIVFALIPDGASTWLVGEYVEGTPLNELIETLSAAGIYLIVKDLLSALLCLERLGLVHGDLSPANVVVDTNGQVRLLDFDSCSRIGEPLTSGSTSGFSAPERQGGQASSPSIDLWSVAALIVWMLTEQTPRLIEDDACRVVAVEVSQEKAALAALADLRKLATGALNVDPGMRPSAADMDQEIKRRYRWLASESRLALSSLIDTRPSQDECGDSVIATSSAPPQQRVVSARLGLLALLILIGGLGLTVYPAPHNYALVIDTSRIAPATPLPAEFDQDWIGTAFQSSLPSHWVPVTASNVNGLSMSVNCERGVCELLLQRQENGVRAVGQAIVLNTSDERVWRAAIANLARAIATD